MNNKSYLGDFITCDVP